MADNFEMMPYRDVGNNNNVVPWGECATLWRLKGRQCDPGDEEMIAAATLREIVRLAASMKPSARNGLRINLPDRDSWPYGYFGKQQLGKLIKLENL